jgi:mannose-6-phosphate isomerase-like protein (cupin superfamily)
MHGYIDDIETVTLENTDFRHVLYTSLHSQLVVMSVAPGDEIGMEVHPDNDQFFRIESGKGLAVIEEEEFDLRDGTALLVPAGTRHNIVNVSDDEPLRLYTIYSPAHHPDGTVHKTKEEALAAEKAEEANEE